MPQSSQYYIQIVSKPVSWVTTRNGNHTYSSLIQLPTDIPPQLMPPMRLPAKLSFRMLALLPPTTLMGLEPRPAPHCIPAMAESESLRPVPAVLRPNDMALPPTGGLKWPNGDLPSLGICCEGTPCWASVEARCKADVRVDCPGETGECREREDDMSMGAVGFIMNSLDVERKM